MAQADSEVPPTPPPQSRGTEGTCEIYVDSQVKVVDYLALFFLNSTKGIKANLSGL